MGLVGAPVILESHIGVVTRQDRIGLLEQFTVQTKTDEGIAYRDQFEILAPDEALARGVKIQRRNDAVEGRQVECTGDGLPPHRPWRTVWYSVSVSRTLVAFCPACGTYYLGGEAEGA